MGRNKQFEREAVLERAMQLFWLHGYDGVTTQVLVDAMGINRKSVYAEFGNKQKLYHAALDKYLCHVIPQRFEALNSDDTGLQAIFDLLDRFANAAGRAGPEKGCMLCNAAAETAHQDTVARQLVDRYFTVIRSSLANALNAAKRKGELSADFDTDVWAASLATTLIGMFVMIRSKADSGAVRTAAEMVKLQLTNALKSDP